ncbi:regulator [Bacillus canaveralius]|uniref:Regulator n=1 Tax=Bacillus canaveralius TaxID=1403243 RepID=A0A2N5GH39_9BACI|nr:MULTISPECIES: intercompartmental signaling factor BofC [Bacillus]PLR80052.1 regulator [Bacillus canaveralius]PLR83906.1 regulator [Bacillus sp. V33-4]PLR89051.1 regulator [Bacillus canaveralius]
MRSKWAAIVLSILGCFAAWLFVEPFNLEMQLQETTVSAQEKPQKGEKISGPLEISVIFERVYLDGEISEERVKETVWSTEDFWAKYAGWQIVDLGENRVVFRQHIDDISPLLKANGYFGITDKGILTIFNGRPDQSNVIHSFFQIDIGKLESVKREQLKKGIPVMTKDRYEKVLETFKTYSTQKQQ